MELTGLLDKARKNLRGLLGDFPEGFNRGATIGMAGWPGDMGYVAQMPVWAARGESLPAAVDVPGTTDYLAAQAGYPIPQTLSGQLGAAVGGLMSPSPTDLAKFAPVLSAIPAWHGSPYKFDAFDLAHMGKGEGAQAYGWGAYLAEPKSTAEWYAENLAGKDVKPSDLISSDGKTLAEIMSDAPAMARAKVTSHISQANGDLAKARESLDAFVDEWVSKPSVSEEGKRTLLAAKEWIAKLQGSNVQFHPKPTGNIYRTSLEWPDPAKEAATPLKGEDLLQWDKPMSEQPERVRQALESDEKIREAFLLENGERLPSSITGGELYSIMTNRNGWQSSNTASVGAAMRPVSEHFRAIGIPGIRYLDQMSRGEGKGTYNYVMFDDQAIKLLERNGKPIEQFAARRAGKAKPYKESR